MLKKVTIFIIVSIAILTTALFYRAQNNKEIEAASAPRTGLVGWWTMDTNDMNPTGATLYDKSGRGNSGLLYGTTTSTGKIGQARSFNGTNNQIALTTIGLPTGTLGTMTVSLWAKPSATLGNLYVFEYGTCGSNNQWAIIGGTTSWSWSNCATGDINSTTTPKIGRWDNIATVYDGTKKYFYINGVLENAITYSSFNITDTAIQLGSYHGSNYFPGSVDDVRIYNRALSAQEVAQLYSSAKTSYAQSPQRASSTPVSGGKLVGWWTMDTNDMSANGATMYDKSGQNNNGTMIGTTTSTGKIGQSRSFNGTSDYINVASLTPNIATNGTASISGWYKFDQTASQKGASMGLHSQIYQHTANNYFYLTNGADFFNVASVIIPRIWHHVVLTYNGNHSTMALYIDGIRYSVTLQTTSDTSAMSSFIIGSSTTFFDGSIDDVRIYNYVLSAQEVTNLYSASAKKYTAAAPREGLVGWWTMDANDMSATGATMYDKSGQNNHGTVTGTTTSTGRINQARSFDGLLNNVNFGDKTVHRFTETSPFSITIWFKTAVGNQLKELVEKKFSSDLYRIIMQTDGSLYFEINDGTNNLVVNPTTSLVNNIWHQAILTYDGANLLTAYVDGVNIGTDNSPALSGVSTSGGNLTVGAGNNGTFSGSIDDVRVYNRALSASEVAGLYESAKKNYVQ